MSLYKTDAIVLKHYELGEADKIIVLYTRNNGKVKAVANGVRKTKSRLAGGVELFTYNQLLLYQGKSLAKISQCDILESFATIRSDLFKMAYASYLTEVINEFTVEEEKNEPLFALLLTTLYLLAGEEDLELITRFFELRLLNLLGYKPEIERCVDCGKELSQIEEIKFSSQAGGIVCSKCAPFYQYAMWTNKGVIATMARLFEINHKKLNRLKVPAGVRTNLEKLIPNYLQSIIEKKLQSLNFIKTLKEVET